MQNSATKGWLLIAFSNFIYASTATIGTVFFNGAWANEGIWWHTVARGAVIVSTILWANFLFSVFRAISGGYRERRGNAPRNVTTPSPNEGSYVLPRPTTFYP